MRFQERLKWNIYIIKLKDNRVINLRHDNNDLLLIKYKEGKNINYLLDKIKNKGEIVNKPEIKIRKRQVSKELMKKMKVKMVLILKFNILK